MQSKAKTVDEYFKTVPKERLVALKKLRALCKKTLKGYIESMQYGMPGYKRPDEVPEVNFASQKQYISVYILRKDVLDKYRDELTTKNVGKGCIRYNNPEKIDFDIIEKMLKASTKSEGAIC
jgi:uncharacterized protein YdhG (YjbR/CyaY superfamily)